MAQQQRYNQHRLLSPWWLAAGTALLCLGNPGMRPAIAGPPIGINIGNVNDWDSELLFADAQKQGRYWMDSSDNFLANIDSNGWPLQDARDGLWFGASGSPKDISGVYALSFNGQATLSIAAKSGTNATISNQVYNSGTNTGVTNVKLMRPTEPQPNNMIANGNTVTPQFVRTNVLVSTAGQFNIDLSAGSDGTGKITVLFANPGTGNYAAIEGIEVLR